MPHDCQSCQSALASAQLGPPCSSYMLGLVSDLHHAAIESSKSHPSTHFPDNARLGCQKQKPDVGKACRIWGMEPTLLHATPQRSSDGARLLPQGGAPHATRTQHAQAPASQRPWNSYLPMQKSRKTTSNTLSDVTSPATSPTCRSASRVSSATAGSSCTPPPSQAETAASKHATLACT